MQIVGGPVRWTDFLVEQGKHTNAAPVACGAAATQVLHIALGSGNVGDRLFVSFSIQWTQSVANGIWGISIDQGTGPQEWAFSIAGQIPGGLIGFTVVNGATGRVQGTMEFEVTVAGNNHSVDLFLSTTGGTATVGINGAVMSAELIRGGGA